ncbi:carboxylesterase family protein [Parvularcula sp. ZS-1/3]|uniref:Carboxylic ester hydrolase n=1 Tax=Parvularcula mediterranea TaxID=2732508 RepID=A0A7Y3RMZ2_9PROT|nr:carboxylesterase family protein [Parvularcula mediterranea]NNU16242.1 carboxylesterase family protein [Parvularcula mediterranea]
MSIIRTLALTGLSAATLAACEQQAEPEATPEANAATARTLDTGEVVGFIEENGAHVWRGLPYAADTSGENRWRAPQPVGAWEGTREALTFSEPCPQIATPFTQLPGFVNGELEGSEDCLALDVYTPGDVGEGDLPVMVWIHGGSNVSGASQLYRGHNLAVNENVIVISVQYRLGPLGFFSHPGLDDDAQELKGAANFAILDLIAALEWVQRNAEAFGGDPDNVTIFGESAGAHNVNALLVSPLSDDLFHGAIIQSGLVSSTTIPEARGQTGEEPNPSDIVVDALGGADKLRTVTVDDVFAAYEKEDGQWMNLPRMIEDGVTIPAEPMAGLVKDPSAIKDVPIITGTNRDEMKLFFAFDERLTKSVLGVFRVPRDKDLYNAASEYSSRVWRTLAVHQVAGALVDQGKYDVYTYRFDWDEGGKFLIMDLGELLGAGHAIEIPFVFNRFDLLGDADGIMFNDKNKEGREGLSRAMGSYWANFARGGIPRSRAGSWRPYGAVGGSIVLDSENDGGISMQLDGETLEDIKADLLVDQRITDEERCEIAGSLLGWSDDSAEVFALESCQSADDTPMAAR